jgi:hypothetical protein
MIKRIIKIMSDSYPRRKRFSNKRFSEVISEGFYLFRKTYLTIIVPMSIIFIINLIIKILLVTDLNWQLNLISPAIEIIIQKDPSAINNADLTVMFEFLTLILTTEFLNNLTSSIFNVFAVCLISNYLINKFSGSLSSFTTELKSALNGRLLLVVLLLGVGIAVGSFLIIPSIIIYGYYIFYVFTYHSEEGDHPVKKARELARGSFWKIVSIFILSNLVLLIADFIFSMLVDPFLLQISDSSWYNPSTRNYGLIILYNLLYSLPAFLLAPLFICLLTSLYVSLKNGREQQIQYLSPSSQPPEVYESVSNGFTKNMKSGMYCPFCGEYNSRKTNYCLHCGEKINFEK